MSSLNPFSSASSRASSSQAGEELTPRQKLGRLDENIQKFLRVSQPLVSLEQDTPGKLTISASQKESGKFSEDSILNSQITVNPQPGGISSTVSSAVRTVTTLVGKLQKTVTGSKNLSSDLESTEKWLNKAGQLVNSYVDALEELGQENPELLAEIKEKIGVMKEINKRIYNAVGGLKAAYAQEGRDDSQLERIHAGYGELGAKIKEASRRLKLGASAVAGTPAPPSPQSVSSSPSSASASSLSSTSSDDSLSSVITGTPAPPSAPPSPRVEKVRPPSEEGERSSSAAYSSSPAPAENTPGPPPPLSRTPPPEDIG